MAQNHAADGLLAGLTEKYLWWESSNGSAPPVRRLVAQIMNLGEFGDVQHVEAALGTDVFRDAIEHAEPGWFNLRSWSYWNQLR